MTPRDPSQDFCQLVHSLQATTDTEKHSHFPGTDAILPLITSHTSEPTSIFLSSPKLSNSHFKMCHWYAHQYTCKHVTYALGKYCPRAGLVQTPCKKKTLWQTIRMGEECEDCAVPEGRGGCAAVEDGGAVPKVTKTRISKGKAKR